MGLSEVPSLEVAEDLFEAMEAFNEREIFGPPLAGGSRSQPLWWIEAIRCVLHAKHTAEQDKKKNKKPPNPFDAAAGKER